MRNRLLIIAVAVAAVPFVGCSDSDSNSAAPADAVHRALEAMQNADSYHISVSALVPASNYEGTVEIDVAKPNRYHALVYSPKLSHEQVWAESIHIRDCDNGTCEEWKVLPRPTPIPTPPFGEEVAGFPALPILALTYASGVETSVSDGIVHLSGTFDVVSHLGGDGDQCSGVEVGPLDHTPVPITCVVTPAPTITPDPRFDIWLDQQTFRLVRADVYGNDLGDLRYDYSKYGEVVVEEPR